MHKLSRRSLGAIAVGAALSTNARAAGRAKTIALTFDDLPYAAAPFPEDVRAGRRVTDAILHSLVRHRAPAIGFVNEGRVMRKGEEEEGKALLRSWISGGMSLGNHSYSHADFNGRTVAEYEKEIVDGAHLIADLMQTREPYQRYFRFPYNHTGSTPETKAHIEEFLTRENTRLAPHTVDSADYLFNWPYLAALQRGDAETAAKLRAAYGAFVIASLRFSEEAAQAIFGREIAHVMLMHANDINADVLDGILSKLRDRGYTFVSLDAALADGAYTTPDTYVSRAGPDWLWRWRNSKGLTVSFNGQPEPPRWVSDLAQPFTKLPNDPSNPVKP